MNDFDVKKSTMEWLGMPLCLSSGEIGRQAAGSVCVSYGDTRVFVAVTFGECDEGRKFGGLALTTQFYGRRYAIGKIPQGFVKREGKFSEREVLISRMVDRAIRPLINQDLVNEISIFCQLLTYDGKIPPEVPSLIGASAAVKLAGVPLKNIAIGVSANLYADDALVFNEVKSGKDLILSSFVGCTKGDIVMVESDAKEVPEDRVCCIFDEALKCAEPVFDFVEEFCKSVGTADEDDYIVRSRKDIMDEIKSRFGENILDVYKKHIKDKCTRHRALAKIHREIFEYYADKNLEKSEIEDCIKGVENAIAREKILSDEIRVDGRGLDEIRNISICVNYLPGLHGSALFTRGGTQSIAVVTLGSRRDAQMVDDFEGERRESFLLHYNFPPYAVGEVGALRAPSRREMGHGRLALKSMEKIIPSEKDFSYTIRVVSEITESDGSSSMATVCATSLALMDAGVPIKKHVAGVAMGLIYGREKHVILTDISGDEDSLGDMDFKVAGTKDGITGLQMDIKVGCVNLEIIKKALSHALRARLSILEKMENDIFEPRDSVKDSAPKVVSYEIPAESVHKVIGSGGKVIKSLCEENSSKIDIDENNVVHIMSNTHEDLTSVRSKIDAISGAVLPKVGEIYQGKIASIVDFGLFISLSTGHDGLVHISEIQNRRIDSIYTMFTEGAVVKVKVKEIARDGKIRLTMRMNEDRSVGRDDDGYHSGKIDNRNGFNSRRERRPHAPGRRRDSFRGDDNMEGAHHASVTTKRRRFF